jgi:OOP family OmpA-OmpF porin
VVVAGTRYRNRFAAFALVLTLAFGCASGTPRPLYCGLAGLLIGGGAGVGVQGAVHGWHASAGTYGAGAAIGAVAGWIVGAGACLLLHKEEKKEAPPPPPPPPPKAEPAPPPKEKIVLRGVNFDLDKATIRPDAKVILDEAAAILKRNPDVKVKVDGYTDSTGTKEYNQKLSERRAASVVEYLGAQGVETSHLTPRGFGEGNPVDTNKTKEGRAKNRRVELLVGE